MKRLHKVRFVPVTAVVGLALLSAISIAAQEANPAQQPDSNARAARLSYVEGGVQISKSNQILANPALANTPLFEGTVVSTSEDGQAELQFDDGTVARISPNSSLKITKLHQQDGMTNAEMLLENGLAYFEMQGDTSASRMTVRFGDSTVTASGFTVFRLNLDNPPGELADFSGNTHLVRGNTLSLDLHGGESVALNATDPNLYNLAETIEPDSWDAWNADRDQQLTSQGAARTVASNSEPNSGNPAWGDLDASGNWYNVPGQGYVWSPNEASAGDWDPYGCGNWVNNPPYGYIWVSCESWGYLPYSMGYWNFYDDFGWGWTPGYGYPWWSTGGWGWNIGNRPVRYQPPHRPHGGPIGAPGSPLRRGGSYQPNPVIKVNRIPSAPVANPGHVVGRPVTIAGSKVEPLRPLSPRPTYNQSASGGFSRSFQSSGNAAGPHYGYSGNIPWSNSGGGNYGGGRSTMPAYSTGGTYRPPAAAPSRGYSGGGSTSRPSSGGAGGHVSGGGGGGGGGGGHASGGAAPAGGGHH
jgi:FecR protein